MNITGFFPDQAALTWAVYRNGQVVSGREALERFDARDQALALRRDAEDPHAAFAIGAYAADTGTAPIYLHLCKKQVQLGSRGAE